MLSLRGDEDWGKIKILGSMLCSSFDIVAQCVMGNIAFQCFWKIWIYGLMITLIKELFLYGRTCVSLMMCNCGSWSVPNTAIDKLDSNHCKHLRTITGHQWPNSQISNKTQKKMCNTISLSTMVTQLQWSMFCHVLWIPKETPVMGPTTNGYEEATTVQTCLIR